MDHLITSPNNPANGKRLDAANGRAGESIS